MTSKSTVLAVVVLLGLVALVSLGGAIFLVGIDKAVPDGIWTLGAGAAGALGALLARTGSEAAPVQVVNPPSDPVPVEDPSAGQGL